MFIMKEDDPTVFENHSSPVKGGTSDGMPPSSNGGGAWTPLKQDASITSPRSTAGPSSPEDSDIDGGMISPMQHLMTDDSNNHKGGMNGTSSSKILRSDDEYYDVAIHDSDSDKQGPQKPSRKRAWYYFLGCVVLAIIAAAVVTTVLLLMEQNKNNSSSESSSSTNDPPVVVVVTEAPVPAPVPVTTTGNTSYAPSSVPSLNRINGTAAPTINDRTNLNATATPTLFVSTPTVPSTNSTGSTMVPTFAPVNATTTAPVSAVVTEENAALVLPILQTFLMPSDFMAISSDSTSVFAQSYQYMISSDTFLASSSSTYTELQVFQRYIIIVLNSLLKPSLSATQISVRVNPAGDHCTWIGVTCNTNTTDDISDGVVTDLVWTEHSLQGTIPSTIQYLSSLTKLDFGTNELSGTIPEALYTNLTNLEHLYLHDNEFSGTLSNTGLQLLSNLKHLFLNSNRFTGSLPQNLGSQGTTTDSARPLQWLNLYNNSFVGAIPLNWNLRNVFLLDLGRNQLTGSIPADWIDDMFELRILYLNNNKLSGSFPTNFPLIGNNRLWLLSVSDNQLTGVIPGGYNVRQMDLSEFQNNLFTSMDTLMCRNIVFIGGEMISMRADCGATCPCEYYCTADLCY